MPVRATVEKKLCDIRTGVKFEGICHIKSRMAYNSRQVKAALIVRKATGFVQSRKGLVQQRLQELGATLNTGIESSLHRVHLEQEEVPCFGNYLEVVVAASVGNLKRLLVVFIVRKVS